VVRYFRPSDYYYMAGSTLAFPGALWLMESASPARGKGKLSAAMKLSAALGLCGGFLYAYQRSTFRFWGWSENEREQQQSQCGDQDARRKVQRDPPIADNQSSVAVRDFREHRAAVGCVVVR